MAVFRLGGHRGFGCTDHEFFQTHRSVKDLPVENTLESIEAAFRAGADYVETDALMSADGIVFTLHNVMPKDHFFGDRKPTHYLNEMNFSDIRHYKTGRQGRGVVTELSKMLEGVARLDPKTAPWAINIEIKGVQKSGQVYEENDYLLTLAQVANESPVSAERILWSSDSLQNIIRMSHLFPLSSFGMLFGEKTEAENVYSNHQGDFRYQEIPFDPLYVDRVCQEWASMAHPEAVLGYVHPEIMTLTPAWIDRIAGRFEGINTWTLYEELTPEREAYYKEIARYAAAKNVAFTAITDYLPEMRRFMLNAS